MVGDGTQVFTVGAVYDRAYFVDSRKKRAVIDRAYSYEIFIALRIRRPDSRRLSNFSERPPASSFPERFRHWPATITLSMFERFACMITADTASFIGCMLIPLVEIITRSACLPGFNDPMRSSMHSMRAPLIVIHARASRV